jgi:hypothetical protein
MMRSIFGLEHDYSIGVMVWGIWKNDLGYCSRDTYMVWGRIVDGQ